MEILILTVGLLISGPGCMGPGHEGGLCKKAPLSVESTPLTSCSEDPLTGFYRDGHCVTGPEDRGTHVVCARMTEGFLRFTRDRGNDLSTPAPRFRFPGLKPGDRWCLCALRWKEALEAGVAPPVVVEATEASALRFVSLGALRKHAVER